jgi:hypothetical protein
MTLTRKCLASNDILASIRKAYVEAVKYLEISTQRLSMTMFAEVQALATQYF